MSPPHLTKLSKLADGDQAGLPQIVEVPSQARQLAVERQLAPLPAWARRQDAENVKAVAHQSMDKKARRGRPIPAIVVVSTKHGTEMFGSANDSSDWRVHFSMLQTYHTFSLLVRASQHWRRNLKEENTAHSTAWKGSSRAYAAFAIEGWLC